MHVDSTVVLKLFDLVDQVPEGVAAKLCAEMGDQEVADLLDLFVRANEEAGAGSSALLRTAVDRLRVPRAPFA